MAKKLTDTELDEIRKWPPPSAVMRCLLDHIDAQAAEIERLRDALRPFALFGQPHVDGRDDVLSRVVEIGHQALTVGAFQSAIEELTDGKRKT